MPATITKGYSFGATELVTNSKLHSLVDSATISGIVNAEVASGAAIALSKMATSTATYMIVHNGSGVPVAVDITGAVDVTNAGYTTLNLVVNNGDIITNDDELIYTA
jgi:hypothetical protein